MPFDPLASVSAAREVLDAAPDGMVLCDADGVIVYANRPMCLMAGYTSDELVGSNVDTLVPASRRDAHAGSRERYMASSSTRPMGIGLELVMTRRDGVEVPVEISLSSMAMGADRFVVASVRDVTERRELQQRLAATERRDHLIDELLADLSTRSLSGLSREQVCDAIASAAANLCDTANAAVLWSDEHVARVLGRYGPLVAAVSTADALPLDPAFLDSIRLGERAVIDNDVRASVQGFEDAVGVFLGAPLPIGGEAHGSLVVVRAPGEPRFDDDDAVLLTRFARQAALVLLAAEGRLSSERVRLLDDRERIARDLHDTVIQDMFAAGMRISAAMGRIDDADTNEIFSGIVDQIDTSIRRVRSVVFDLHRSGLSSLPLTQVLLGTVREASRALGFLPALTFVGNVDSLPVAHGEHIEAVIREALSNVARHARASSASVDVTVNDDRLTVTVADNGVGIDPAKTPGTGSLTMRERADRLGGSMQLEPGPTGGTVVLWSVPADARP